MKFTLEIDLGNDAMQTGTDVIKSIRESLKGEESLPLDEGTAGILWDVNGNKVGSWKATEDSLASPIPTPAQIRKLEHERNIAETALKMAVPANMSWVHFNGENPTPEVLARMYKEAAESSLRKAGE
jgi:hypothetical protein